MGGSALQDDEDDIPTRPHPHPHPPPLLSPSLSSFLRSEHLHIQHHIPSPSQSRRQSHSSNSAIQDPFQCLTIEEHIRRSSITIPRLPILPLLPLQDSRSNPPPTAILPHSPAADEYCALYPLPPHLTPQHSPVATPQRVDSPALFPPDDHHDLPTTRLLGKLTISVVQAKDLSIKGPPNIEAPYVLLQYDRTESVSREWGAPPPSTISSKKEQNGKRSGPSRPKQPPIGNLGMARAREERNSAGTTTSSSSTTRRGFGKPTQQQPPPLKSHASYPPPFASSSPPPSSSLNGAPPSSSTLGAPHTTATPNANSNGEAPGDPAVIGTAKSPIWNHHCQFDVVSEGRTILICVYDKLAPVGGFPAHGFLGATVFEPPLNPDPGDDALGLDVWVPLESALDPTVGGEVRLRILFETETAQERPKLSVDDFQVLKLIGEGSFGQVFRVRKRDTKRVYAMKVIQKESVVSKSALNQVLAERQVLARTLDSPFLVGLKFSFQSPTDLFFVIDYKSGGELFSHLQKDGGRFEEDKVRFYLCEIVLALEYLHARGIIYRDLKPENCLLDGSGHVVLVDFGLSKLLDSPDAKTRTLCGTTAFMAPEVLLDVGYDHMCDWWSLGVLLFEMCYGWSPFYAESRVEEYERILSGEIKIPTKKGYSPEGRDLLLKLLTRDPELRIGAQGGAEEIQSHAFFSKIDWRAVALRQISPPFKPPTRADDDECGDRGRSGDWMFSSNGSSWHTSSARGSFAAGHGNGSKLSKPLIDQQDNLFRDFTFTSARVERDWEDSYRTKGNRRSSWTGKP
ncbi:kinase-like protein [Meredithblackwellia eburnea MCA 4105]